MKNKLYLYLCLLLSGIMSAQQITGVVSSEDGPLPGATVVVKGTNAGTTTDFDGNFTISAQDGDVLVVSFVGFSTAEVTVAGQDQINVSLSADSELEEVIVTGYGSQREREVTSAAVKVTAESFNKGPINDAISLLQGKVAGLSVYKPGGNPNETPTIRVRGISTLGANSSPLIVVDGVAGATLNNIDPNDIASFTVLKDGSGAAIYGTRGSAGVILIETKTGDSGPVKFNYNTSYSSVEVFNNIPVYDREQFLAVGGTDLGTETDWIKEITQSANSQVHNLSASGGTENSSFRVSANVREETGILLNTGFDQFNTRANFKTTGMNDKLKLSMNMSFSRNDADLGDEAAYYYATFYNPTAPVRADDPKAKYQVNTTQFGGYFEQLGLYDSFNPVSIAAQTTNRRKSTDFNYNINASYALTENLSITGIAAQERVTNNTRAYRPTTMLYSGNPSAANAASPVRKGAAQLSDFIGSSQVYEMYGTWNLDLGSSSLVLTGGYSYNQFNSEGSGIEIFDFPDNSLNWGDNLSASQDRLNGNAGLKPGSYKSPDEKLIAMFARANLTIGNNIFVNASLRREGSSKLGENEQWGVFPGIGIGLDANNMFNLGFDKLKVRAGLATTGALPDQNGLTKPLRRWLWAGTGTAGGATTLLRAANPDLKWEEKQETNFGVEFESGKLAVDLDIYSRKISDFILNRQVDVVEFGVDRRYENAGQLTTNGVELNIEYDVIQSADLSYSTGLVLSTFNNTLDEYVLDKAQYGYLGAPGQNAVAMIRVAVGEPLGQIYGPVYTGADPVAGTPIFEDLNNDGNLNVDAGNVLQDDYDGKVLGSGYPTMEIGWSNQVNIGNWSINAFFRAAYGHSLINTFRAFYEPLAASQTSYNKMDTPLADPNLTVAQYSSLYVEKADFFMLDNLTIAHRFDFGADKQIKDITVSFNAIRPLLFTDYTGTSPEPEFYDSRDDAPGVVYDADYNILGGARTLPVSSGQLLTPGIDRRKDYYNTRSYTVGLNINF